jgi:CubicO group peptidase (beta-lactamase class C family)
VSRARRLRRLAAARLAAPAPQPADVRLVSDELPADVSGRVERAVAEQLGRVRVPGAQVVIRRGGTLLWAADAGRLDGRTPVASSDASSSRRRQAVVATLAALLVDRGALDLDAPVARWLPALPYRGRLSRRRAGASPTTPSARCGATAGSRRARATSPASPRRCSSGSWSRRAGCARW